MWLLKRRNRKSGRIIRMSASKVDFRVSKMWRYKAVMSRVVLIGYQRWRERLYPVVPMWINSLHSQPVLTVDIAHLRRGLDFRADKATLLSHSELPRLAQSQLHKPFILYSL
jgi:hypothetical protein